MILELIGYDEGNKIEYIMGERQTSLFQLILKQVADEREAQRRTTLQALGGAATDGEDRPMGSTSRASATPEQIEAHRHKMLEKAAAKKVESEFGDCSAKFQALFKTSFVQFNKTKDEIIKKEAAKAAQSKDSEEAKKEADKPKVS